MIEERRVAALWRRHVLVAALLALADFVAPRASAALGFGINLVRLQGILGVAHTPGDVMTSTLIVDGKDIPFSVRSAERLSDPPSQGAGVLLPIGNDQPRIVLYGEPAFLHPIEDAPPGTPVTILGNLNVGMSFVDLMGVDLPPSTGAQ